MANSLSPNSWDRGHPVRTCCVEFNGRQFRASALTADKMSAFPATTFPKVDPADQVDLVSRARNEAPAHSAAADRSVVVDHSVAAARTLVQARSAEPVQHAVANRRAPRAEPVLDVAGVTLFAPEQDAQQASQPPAVAR